MRINLSLLSFIFLSRAEVETRIDSRTKTICNISYTTHTQCENMVACLPFQPFDGGKE